jgi:hypothetical protein
MASDVLSTADMMKLQEVRFPNEWSEKSKIRNTQSFQVFMQPNGEEFEKELTLIVTASLLKCRDNVKQYGVRGQDIRVAVDAQVFETHSYVVVTFNFDMSIWVYDKTAPATKFNVSSMGVTRAELVTRVIHEEMKKAHPFFEDMENPGPFSLVSEELGQMTYIRRIGA